MRKGKLPKTGVEVLARALEIWGPKGEHWIKGEWAEDGNYCLYGGIDMAAHGRVTNMAERGKAFKEAEQLLSNAVHRRDIVEYNDAIRRRFSHVKALVCKILKRELGVMGPKRATK